jgi:hypothetical protein
MFRSHVTIDGVAIEDVIEFENDWKKYIEDYRKVKDECQVDEQVIEKTNEHEIIYKLMNIPCKIVSNRDIIERSDFFVNVDQKRFLKVNTSVKRDDIPEKSGVVRMSKYQALLYEEKDGQVHFTEISTHDLGGWISASWSNKGLVENAKGGLKMRNDILKSIKTKRVNNL